MGVHWLRFVTSWDLDSVLDHLAGALGESVVVLPHGFKGYRAGYQVGPVKVSAEGHQEDMGRLVDIGGLGCEELGLTRLAALYRDLAGKATRIDVAADHCPFTPAQLRDEWRAGNVRTRCKVPDKAREDRQWRTSKWDDNHRGDTFAMGSRTSSQYGRCYDERGWTRFELEAKHELAPIMAGALLAAESLGDMDAWRSSALGFIRRLVDFVDQDSATHASRRSLLPFWETFISGAQKARVVFGGGLLRTVEDVRDWVNRQVAPGLALLVQVFGLAEVETIARGGQERWGPRHLAMLRASAVPA